MPKDSSMKSAEITECVPGQKAGSVRAQENEGTNTKRCPVATPRAG